LSIMDLTSSWFNITYPTRTIVGGGIESYLVKFSVPSDAGVADYNAKFNASSSQESTFKSFVLTVTPGLVMRIEINSTLTYYQDQLPILWLEINETKSKGYNTSETEDYYELLENKIDIAIGYRDAENYKAAYDTFDEIDSLFNETRTALSLAKGEKFGIIEFGDWWSWGKWVVIGVVGVVGAFLGYLFWPSEGVPKIPTISKPAGQAPPPTGPKGKLNEKFEALKERWKKIREKKEKTKYHVPKV